MSFSDFVIFTILVISSFYLGWTRPGFANEPKHNLEVIQEIIQSSGDFIKIEINGHHCWVIYLGHAEDCPCGKGNQY